MLHGAFFKEIEAGYILLPQARRHLAYIRRICLRLFFMNQVDATKLAGPKPLVSIYQYLQLRPQINLTLETVWFSNFLKASHPGE